MDDIEKRVDESWKDEVAKEKGGQKPGDMPQANFAMFISGLALQALMQLGDMPNPVTKKKEKDLNQAQYIIDMLDLLKEKTNNNLTKEESELLENTIYDLKMRFVKAGK